MISARDFGEDNSCFIFLSTPIHKKKNTEVLSISLTKSKANTKDARTVPFTYYNPSRIQVGSPWESFQFSLDISLNTIPDM